MIHGPITITLVTSFTYPGIETYVSAIIELIQLIQLIQFIQLVRRCTVQ